MKRYVPASTMWTPSTVSVSTPLIHEYAAYCTFTAVFTAPVMRTSSSPAYFVACGESGTSCAWSLVVNVQCSGDESVRVLPDFPATSTIYPIERHDPLLPRFRYGQGAPCTTAGSSS